MPETFDGSYLNETFIITHMSSRRPGKIRKGKIHAGLQSIGNELPGEEGGGGGGGGGGHPGCANIRCAESGRAPGGQITQRVSAAING